MIALTLFRGRPFLQVRITLTHVDNPTIGQGIAKETYTMKTTIDPRIRHTCQFAFIALTQPIDLLQILLHLLNLLGFRGVGHPIRRMISHTRRGTAGNNGMAGLAIGIRRSFVYEFRLRLKYVFPVTSLSFKMVTIDP